MADKPPGARRHMGFGRTWPGKLHGPENPHNDCIIYAELAKECMSKIVDGHPLERAIAATLRTAVEREREVCAAIAKRMTDKARADDYDGWYTTACLEIEAAISARSETDEK